MLLALIAASALLAPAAAPAATEKPADVAPVTVQGKDGDPMVCKTSVPLGSKVPTRTCRRKSEAEQAREDGRRFVEDVQRTKEPFFRPKEP